MPRPSPLACTAIVPPEPSASQAASPQTTGKRRGNPTLALAPRCGARTRAGCPCRAPAIRGKRRCRMHGGRSTGPRTESGRARIAAARTIHGRYGAECRGRNRRILSWVRRGRVLRSVIDRLDLLPPELAARFDQEPWELTMPVHSTGGISAAQDRAMQRAEAAALAPWKRAIAMLPRGGRTASPPGGPPATAAPPGRSSPAEEPHAPVPGRGDPGSPEGPVRSVCANPAPEPHAPKLAATGAVAATGSPAAPGVAQARSHAPERAAGARANRPTTPPAQAKAHAPERRAALGPAVTVALPALRHQPAEAHAPERAAGARANRPTTPPAQAKAHAPERSPAAVAPGGLSGRTARRWRRRQKSMHQATAGASTRPAPSPNPHPHAEGEC